MCKQTQDRQYRDKDQPANSDGLRDAETEATPAEATGDRKPSHPVPQGRTKITQGEEAKTSRGAACEEGSEPKR